MKPIKSLLLSAAFLLPVTFTANAQKPSVGCIDKSVRLEADEIKQFYVNQGLVVYRDAMINMESMEPFPIMTDLQKGQLYMIIFVGHTAVQRMKMEMYDGNDHKMDEKFMLRSRQQPNYIIYAVAPERTDSYLFTFMQKLKNESMCGSVCIMKMPPGKQAAEIKPFQQ